MTNLSRRGLFGVAGVVATAPLVTPVAAAEEHWPPNGHVFCEGCEKRGWEGRFYADIATNWNSDRIQYDVLFNGEKHLRVLAAKAGANGWVAELVRGAFREDEDGSYYEHHLCEVCGSPFDIPLRIVYGNVELIDNAALWLPSLIEKSSDAISIKPWRTKERI